MKIKFFSKWIAVHKDSGHIYFFSIIWQNDRYRKVVIINILNFCIEIEMEKNNG